MKPAHTVTRAHCRGCGACVFFVPMKSGKEMPLDPEPKPEGTVYRRWGVWHVASKKQPVPPGRPAYIPHFASCPKAKSFRRRPA